MTFGLVVDNAILQTFDQKPDLPASLTLVDLGSAKPTPSEGWITTDGGETFSPPVVVAEIADFSHTISRRQFYQQLNVESLISQSEALAAMSGTIPSELMTLINALPTAQQFPAQMLAAGASQFEISHPVTQAVAAGFKWSETDLAAFWTSAAAL